METTIQDQFERKDRIIGNLINSLKLQAEILRTQAETINIQTKLINFYKEKEKNSQ